MYTNNLIIIIKKEFKDFISNWMILVILGTYSIIILNCIYTFYIGYNSSHSSYMNIAFYAVGSLLGTLSIYGSIVGIMIGCLSIGNERHGNAINTIITKPLFRDTLFNGKLIGSLGFLTIIMGLAALLFTSGILILDGGSLYYHIDDYISSLIVIFIFSLSYVMFFLSFAMLISIIIKDQAFAMILSMVVLIFSQLTCNEVFARDLASIIPADRSIITRSIIGLSPDGMIVTAQADLSSLNNFNDLVVNIMPDIGKLLLYILIICVASYVVFIRKDII